MRFIWVVGSRPNFMKITPILGAIRRFNRSQNIRDIIPILVHIGQHTEMA